MRSTASVFGMGTGMGLRLGLLTLLVSGCVHAESAAAAPSTPRVSPAQRDFDAADMYAARGDFVRAEQYYASALRRGQPDTQVIVKLLRVCLGASRLRAALGYAELYLLRHPDAWSLHYLAAAIHAALDQPVAAQRELLQVLHAQPAHEASLRMLSQLQTPPIGATAKEASELAP